MTCANEAVESFPSTPHHELYQAAVEPPEFKTVLVFPVDHEGIAKFVKMLLTKTIVSPFKLATTGAPSIESPFSHPVTNEFKTETAEFLLKRKAFSNFSPAGSAVVPLPFGPTKVTFEKIGRVFGVAVEPAASLSHSKAFESPGASEISLSRIDRAN